MSEVRLPVRLAQGALFTGLAATLMLVKMLPLSPGVGLVPAPDLLLCLALAWTVRRPDLLPLPLLAAVMLLGDLMLMRPPGLWAGLVVIGTEWLRRRQQPLRAMPFTVECATIGALMTALVLAHWVLLAVLFVEQPSLGRQLVAAAVSLAAYPAVVAVLQFGLGIRKRRPVEGFGAGALRS